MQQQSEDDTLSALNNCDTINTTCSCNFGLPYEANVPGHVVSHVLCSALNKCRIHYLR